MKVASMLLIALATMAIDPVKIGKINTLKKEARDAYLKGNFKTAINKYRYLIDSLNVQEDEVTLNLAHAYFLAKDTANAISNYQTATASSNNSIRSKAQNQLGVLANRKGNLEQALTHLKEAIKSDPTNTEARYNYEMVKKKLEEKKKQEEQKKQNENKQDQQQNKEQQKEQQKQEQQQKEQEQKEQQQKEQKEKEKQKQEQQQKEQENKEKEQQEKEQQEEDKENKEQEKKDIPPSVSEKLQQMQMSEEKAKMILEAMKNQEIQYLQQNKRKATKPRNKNKPDW